MEFFQANRRAFYVLGAVAFLSFFYALFFNAPGNFKPGTVVKIEQGTNLRGVSLLLQNENVIRSRVLFEAFVILLGGEKRIMHYDYLFKNKVPVFEVARRISEGEHGMPAVVVTIPEGFDVSQIADAFSSKLINFNKEKFLLSALPREGYFFPDTYFFLNTNTEQDVFRLMRKNFDGKIESLRSAMVTSGRTEKEIITMASIIEREAKGDADREFISGILWKRLKIGMPLQVDAAPKTYESKGLPSGPICNPGLEAIKAAINPEASNYLYYLHDEGGSIHYAKTFAEHRANILKYLK